MGRCLFARQVSGPSTCNLKLYLAGCAPRRKQRANADGERKKSSEDLKPKVADVLAKAECVPFICMAQAAVTVAAFLSGSVPLALAQGC